MNDFLKNNPLATLSTLLIYFGACAGLWHLGYWSVFEVNYLQYIDISDIIKDFVEPFFSSAVYSIVLMIVVPLYYYFMDSLKFKTASLQALEITNKNKTTSKGVRIFIGLLMIVSIGLYYFTANKYQKLEILPMIIAGYITIYVSNEKYLAKYIEKYIIRLGIYNFIIVLPILSFCTSRLNGRLVWDNVKYKYVKNISFKESIDINPNNYKLLGISRNYIFLTDFKNKTITILNSENIKSITYGEVSKNRTTEPSFRNYNDF